jgi:hypothetical protein
MTAHPQTAPSEPATHADQLVGATGKGHRIAGATGVLLLVALMGMLGVGSADHSEAATAPSAPAVTLTGVEAGGSVQLTATLTRANGHPLPNAQVAFLLSTTEFGSPARLIPLGSATTGSSGLARLRYQPKVAGQQGFAATYTAVGAKPATSDTTVAVTVARSAYHPAPAKPLASVGNVLVMALFAIVAAIWLTLVTQVLRVRRVCRGIQQTAISSV